MTKEENNLIAKEIESWRKYEYALREEDSVLFSKMLNECQQKEEYAKAFKSKGEYNSAESLFMTLIFEQQKMISNLINSFKYKEKSNLGNC